MFKGVNEKVNNAHIETIRVVKESCGSETIFSYLEKNGEQPLADIFNTVGVMAVERYSFTLLVEATQEIMAKDGGDV